MDRESIDEIKRHFGVVAEDLRSAVAAVAEGHRETQERITRLEGKIDNQFEETRALLRLSYGELDRRVRGLESDLADLRARLERVEDRLAS